MLLSMVSDKLLLITRDSPLEKWLQELAVQVEEQKAKKERNRLLQQQSIVEKYFPFGSPGGVLLTDY